MSPAALPPLAKHDFSPKSNQDADTLRAYVSTVKLVQIARLSASASARYEASRREYLDAKAQEAAADLAMREARRQKKAAKAKLAACGYLTAPFWAEVDAARDVAWAEAAQARRLASLNGEVIKIETCEQCTARVNAAMGRVS